MKVIYLVNYTEKSNVEDWNHLASVELSLHHTRNGLLNFDIWWIRGFLFLQYLVIWKYPRVWFCLFWNRWIQNILKSLLLFGWSRKPTACEEAGQGSQDWSCRITRQTQTDSNQKVSRSHYPVTPMNLAKELVRQKPSQSSVKKGQTSICWNSCHLKGWRLGVCPFQLWK